MPDKAQEDNLDNGDESNEESDDNSDVDSDEEPDLEEVVSFTSGLVFRRPRLMVLSVVG